MTGSGGAELVPTVETSGAEATLRLAGELELETAGDLRRWIEEILERDRPGRLLIDLTGVTFLDAAGSRVLAWAYKRMAADGGTLRVSGMTPQVGMRLSQFGLRRVLQPEEPTE